MNKKSPVLWLFRNLSPMVIAAILSEIMMILAAILVLILSFALPAFLFFNGCGLVVK